MRTAGLLLIFGLCTAIGMRLAAKRSERFTRICAWMGQLAALSYALDAKGSLRKICKANDGELFEQLCVYLDMREDGKSEAEAARSAASPWAAYPAESRALVAFFSGLSLCSGAQIRTRVETALQALETAKADAQETAKQAKTIRALGVLIGAGVCILLL